MYWLDENFSMNLKEHLLCAFQEIQFFFPCYVKELSIQVVQYMTY